MDTYTAALSGSGTAEENKRGAQFYEAQGDFKNAGEFWFATKDYSKALRLFLQA